MAKSKFKAVLVGCGGMANAWMKALGPRRDVQIVGLVDVRREAAEALATRYELDPASVVFNTITEAVKATGADVLFDVTIPAAHQNVTIEALKAGCDVLGEKPLSDSLTDARKMVKAAQKADKTYAVMQNRRFLPGIRSVKKLLESGKLGAIEEIHCDFYLGPRFGGFRAEMEHPLLVDMAIHTFDQARMVSSADPVSVYCYTFNPNRSWYKGDASAVAIFEMSDGIVYTYRGSWCAEGVTTSWESDWRIICNNGSVKWDGNLGIQAAQVVGDGKGNMRKTRELKAPSVKLKHHGHPGVIDNFLASLKKGQTPETHCEDNIKSLAMVLAAVKSAKSGRREKVIW